jgi:hypothetical protein
MAGLVSILLLDLSNNTFSGDIPTGLCNLTTLSINIQNTSLCYPGCLKRSVNFGTPNPNAATRCVSTEDLALCDLVGITDATDQIQAASSTDYKYYSTDHPFINVPTDDVYIEISGDTTAYFSVAFDSWTDVVKEGKFCLTSTCQNVFSSFVDFDYPGKTNGTFETIVIPSYSFVAVLTLDCEKSVSNAKSICWGYSMEVSSSFWSPMRCFMWCLFR